MPEASTLSPSSTELPSQARVVIIGGGVMGCSVAYHLTKLGWSEVVLLERRQLTCGSTWHAAGLVGTSGHRTENLIRMSKETLELYARLEAETGQATGFKRNGFLMLACTPEDLEYCRRSTALARHLGLDVQEVSAAEVKRMWPLAYTDDILAAFYAPNDGQVSPVDATMALAKGAKMHGARICEETEVIEITSQGGRVTGVVTNKGPIKAEYVVNCGGMWARGLGIIAGVDIPLHASEHYYFVTEPIDGMEPDLPGIGDTHRDAFYREEQGGILLALLQPIAVPWGMEGIPEGFCFSELAPDWDHVMPYLQSAMARIPILLDTGIRLFFNGPESFTPDHHFHLGEASGLKNFYVAAGMNTEGLTFAGGAASVVAHWIITGQPPMDVRDYSVDRILPFQNNRRFLYARAVECLNQSLGYSNQWPVRPFQTARNIRKSVLHDTLAQAGACFLQSSSGWEYADWFAPPGVEHKHVYSSGRQNWFAYNAAEHQAAREGVVIFDLSAVSKLLVQGPHAERVLNVVCTNNIAVPVGRCVDTLWLNEGGTIEAMMTVFRIGVDSFMLLTSDAHHSHVYTWLKRRMPADALVVVTDVTSGYAMLSVQGPRSRELLSSVTDADVSKQTFPFGVGKEIDLECGRGLALRQSWVGELGWHLLVPCGFAQHVYDALIEAGQPQNLKHAGAQTLNSLRVEKAHPEYGADVNGENTPLEAGLGSLVDCNKAIGFVGEEAFLRQNESRSLRRCLVQFLLQDPDPLLYHGDIILMDGTPVGYLRSSGYGHTLGGSVGLGYVQNPEGVTAEMIRKGAFEIEVAGARVPAVASLQPLYDPDNEKVRG